MLFVLVLTLLGALLPGAARAQVALHWRRQVGAEACPDAAHLRDVVVARVGAGLLVEGEGTTRVLEGEVSPHGAGHQVHLRLREQSGELIGERFLVDEAADCAALTEATALSVALLVESAPPLPSKPSAPAPAAAASATPVPAPEEQPPLPAPRAPRQYALAAGGLGSIGLLPAPRAHVFIGLRVAPTPTYALELELVALGGAEVQLGGASLGRARFSTTYALLAGCRTVVRNARFGLAGCAGLFAGVLRADGSGFSEADYHRRAPLLAGSARLASEVALLGPLIAFCALGVGVPFVHTRFVALDTMAQPRELTSTQALFGTLELGVGARF